MRSKILVPSLLIALIFGAIITSVQGQDEEGTRGAFLSTRVSASGGVGKTSANAGSGPTVRRSRRRRVASRTTTTTTTTNRNTTTSNRSTSNTNASVSVKAIAPGPVGLGYTLYMRDPNGDAVRVDPDRIFRTGDRVRIALETNTDSYLYVFNSTDNGDPVMIYPDVRLDEAGNFMEAHVPDEVPSSNESDERFRWFAFDANPGTEHIYIVLSREPLPGIPIEDELVSYCRSNHCPWRPAPGVWAQIKAALNGQARVVKSKTYGQAQTSTEREATTRGLGLDTTAPPPSVIRMSASSNTGILVTGIDLVHR